MEFEVRDRAVYLPGADTLVCADLHAGRDAASNVELPVGEHEDLTRRFEALLDLYAPAEVVIAGDLLHSFDRIPAGASTTVRTISGLTSDRGCDIVVAPGNHDTMLSELWDGSIEAEYRLADESTVVTHGHVPPDRDAELFVVGHDHPTIVIEGVRRPCYLYGREQYEGASVLMLPSFSKLPAGIVINELSASEFQSPMITDCKGLEPIVYDDENDTTHEFPPLRELRQFL
jgi:putative SbcD/Mre11-related phosphoesterase